MSIRRRRISGRRAERLLRDAAFGSQTDPDPLIRSLATATVPTPDAESAAEEAAVAAFRMARHAHPHTKDSTVRSRLAKLLTAKVATVAFATTAIGVVAFAAGTGGLPGQKQHADQPPADTPGNSRPIGTPSMPATGTVAPAPSPSPSKSPSPSLSLSLSPSTSPSLARLCRAYEQNKERGKALDRPALSTLITAAGGENKIAGYCATLLPTTPGKKPMPTTKGQVNKPTAKPHLPLHPFDRQVSAPSAVTDADPVLPRTGACTRCTELDTGR
ncbi:hypothetical protein [Actinomadura alba]|uniref:Uncharacterized protein n=1 Tax=Actinomadura alba TaxID=406431 RepID=A0ABR7LTV8_9ACTN|nr:hypothetical protein [Actinomadura alba]MBC6468108.1 hypothetical protein [Actinomadura alba]